MSLKSIANDVLPWRSDIHSKPPCDDPKSHPYYYYKAFAPRNAQEPSNSARPRTWYPMAQPRRPVDLSLTTDDIEGSRPRVTHFVTKRCTNPLDPEYKLSSHAAQAVPTVPQLKGAIPTNFIADIEGTHPRRLHREQVRAPSLTVSSRNFRPLRGGGLSSLDVRDINMSADSKTRVSRITDPLDPSYKVSAVNGTALQVSSQVPNGLSAVIGPIEDSKPLKRIRDNPIPPPDPIEGSSPQRYVGVLKHSSLGTFPALTRAPATGSRAGSLNRGIVSRRVTNPLDPCYTFLDGNRDNIMISYSDSDCSTTPLFCSVLK